MSKRRTKIEKMRAQLHQHQIPIANTPQITNYQAPRNKQDIGLNKAAFYTPRLELPIEMLKKDLTKTLIVTILAVILQMSLAYYLNHGGWKLVNNLIINKITGGF